ENGTRTDHWSIEQRIPTYLISLIVGEYETITETWKDIPLEYNGPPGRADEVRRAYANTAAMMEFFTSYTGADYPYPRYAQTTVWDFVYGGMENASATTMNMRLLHTKDAQPNYSPDGLVAHELAHMWFGDHLTCKTWDHIWLNEGFATYMTDLFHEAHYGAEEFALRRRRQNRGYMNGTKKPETLNLKRDPRGGIPLELFGGKQYSRGAAILHQLRLELGDEVFRDGVRLYCRENADRAVVSEDLRRAMERVAGRDLKWFFDQWVYGAGYPVLKVSRKDNTLRVEQVQVAGGGQPGAFRILLPIGIRIEAPNWEAQELEYRDETIVLDVRRRVQTYSLADLKLSTKRDEAGMCIEAGVGGGTFARIDTQQSMDDWGALLRHGQSPAGRLDAVEKFEEYPDAAIAPLGNCVTTDSSWAVREAAVKALGRIGKRAALDALTPGLEDRDARVRVAAVQALGNRSRDESGNALLHHLEKDESPYVRAAAAVGMGKVKAEAAFLHLEALLKEDSHREILRKGALEGLKHLGDPRGVELAHRHLPYNWKRGDHHGMREEALRLLLALAPDAPETHARIVSLLHDPYHRMRQWSAKAAGDHGVRSAIGRLEGLAKNDAFGSIKRAAKAALKKLKPAKPKKDS
ncbi:MAG: M1 family aminopeptidase, partial [Planctomycetota bacterium]